MSTTQLTTFADLYGDLLARVRSQTSVTASSDIAKRYINIALQDLHLGFDYKFPWAERSARLIVRAQYSTGTVSIVQGSTTLTGTNTFWTSTDAFSIANARANGKVCIAGSPIPYIVSSVGGAGAITLTSQFTEASQTTQTYIYFEDEYALAADFLRPIDLQTFSDESNIDLISRTEFRRRYPTNAVPGRVSVACIVDSAPSGSTTPVRHVRFAPPSSSAMTIPYSYVTAYLATSSAGVGQANLSADSDEPIVPLRYRHALVFHALYHWYRDRKDDARSQEAKSEYTDVMLRISADVEVGSVRPQIQPRVSAYARAAQRPWNSAGARKWTDSA